MKTNSYLGPLLRRIFVLSIISIVLVLGFSELSYQILREDLSRAPTTIELLIPEGTAQRIDAGEPVPDIPEEMIFVVGDTLLVKNADVVDHQLGPMWIPGGSSASLKMEQKSNLAYNCSFQPSQYLGLTVKEAVTWKSRLGALGYAAPPTLMFLLVYSFVMFPLKPSQVNSTQTQMGEMNSPE
jgi:hypothetical protein